MSIFSSGDPLNAIVCDVGQYATKIGFAGEDYPRAYFRSNVAAIREGDDPNAPKTKTTTTTSSNDDQKQKEKRRPIVDLNYDYYNRPICSRASDPKEWHDGNWETQNPVDATTGLWYDPHSYNESSGGGADWYDQLELMVQHGYKTSLANAQPENHPFLLMEKSYNPPPIRQQTLECLFEGALQMPAVFLAKDATLACYACGRTTGTVVDMGYGGTTVTPVYEGYVETKGIHRSPVGMLEMDERILQTLDHFGSKQKQPPFLPLYQVKHNKSTPRRADPFHHLARLYVAQGCREEGVGAAVDTTSTAVAFAARNAPFTLPDGQTVNIPPNHRFAVANLLLDKDEQERRDEIVEARKKKLSSYINDANANSDNDKETKVFTDASAVGISSTRRGRKRQASSPKKETPQPKTSFSNRLLQKACIPYLQTYLEEHLTASPLPAMVCDAAYRCDRDQQPQLLGNVVLAGGGACLGPTEQAVPDFLREKVETMIHAHTPGWRVKVLSPGITERKVCSWLGGSILGSLGTFHEMWITRAEYEEYGTAIVNRKCP
ncbi:Actin (Fragment) [Seminavis robusta]|uniref:Actin n=1 Tax=Seminavis robusta TaxID=568900 RepID=A0A9N8HIG9_9STRA